MGEVAHFQPIKHRDFVYIVSLLYLYGFFGNEGMHWAPFFGLGIMRGKNGEH